MLIKDFLWGSILRDHPVGDSLDSPLGRLVKPTVLALRVKGHGFDLDQVPPKNLKSATTASPYIKYAA